MTDRVAKTVHVYCLATFGDSRVTRRRIATLPRRERRRAHAAMVVAIRRFATQPCAVLARSNVVLPGSETAVAARVDAGREHGKQREAYWTAPGRRFATPHAHGCPGRKAKTIRRRLAVAAVLAKAAP